MRRDWGKSLLLNVRERPAHGETCTNSNRVGVGWVRFSRNPPKPRIKVRYAMRFHTLQFGLPLKGSKI